MAKEDAGQQNPPQTQQPERRARNENSDTVRKGFDGQYGRRDIAGKEQRGGKAVTPTDSLRPPKK